MGNLTPRCKICRKKTIIGLTCSCGVYTCITHRHPDLHNCIDQEKNEIVSKDAIKAKLIQESIVIKKLDTI